MDDHELNRQWQIIKESDKVLYLIRDKLRGSPFFLKGTEPPAQFYLDGETDQGFQMSYNPTLDVDGIITLYTTVSRQVEIDFQMVTPGQGGSAVFAPIAARIGATNRTYPRMAAMEGQVVAANFQISKSDLPVDVTRPQITNSVIFRELEQQLSSRYPGIRIFEYADKDRPAETRLLNKRPLTILVTDVNDPASYRSSGPEFADYYAILSDDESLAATMRRYQEHHVKSIMVMPVLLPGQEQKLPFAFFIVETKGDQVLTKDDFTAWQETAVELIKRVEDANTIHIKERQRVLNVSEGGVAVELTHPDLVRNVPNRTRVTFDLIFKMQAPMRFNGRVCYAKHMNDRVVAGIDLEGTGHFDTRVNPRDRLKSYVRMMTA